MDGSGGEYGAGPHNRAVGAGVAAITEYEDGEVEQVAAAARVRGN